LFCLLEIVFGFDEDFSNPHFWSEIDLNCDLNLDIGGKRDPLKFDLDCFGDRGGFESDMQIEFWSNFEE